MASLNQLIIKRIPGAPLLWRVLVFGVVFVLISGLTGPRIISSGLLYAYHFDIYAGAGKALLFAGIAFLLLVWRKPLIDLEAWRKRYLAWAAGAAVSIVVAWIAVTQLIAGADGIWAVLAHVGLLASIVLTLLAIFGLSNIKLILQTYKRELLLSIAIAAAFYLFLLAVYGLWKVLATVVLHAVAWLLSVSGLAVEIVPPRSLLLDKFGIEIAQYCSGIESIALFTGLYTLIGLLDWKRFNLKKYFVVFPIALLVLFGFNILRVYALIMAGFYINPEVAFSLFHTYAGMVFFIIFSGIFWSMMYKRMLKKQE